MITRYLAIDVDTNYNITRIRPQI